MAFLGMRGTGDWVTDQRPKHWRSGILMLYPNGAAQLTALTSLMPSEKLTDPEFSWWTKTLPRQGGDATNVYVDSDMSTAYVYATHQATYGIVGGIVFVKAAAAVAEEFKVGHLVVLRDASDLDVDVRAKVISRDVNGADSRIGVKLLEADDNGSTPATYNLSTVDTILVIGSVHSEGAQIPDAISYDVTKVYNYSGIMRNSLEITRTQLETKLRTGDAYTELKRETLELHSIEIEKQFLDGIKYEGTGADGKPERVTQGLITGIKINNAAGVSHYPTSAYTGDKWIVGGKTWLNEMFEVLFRYGDSEKLAYLGSGALLGINSLADTYGHMNITPATEDYGLKVLKWITPFGEVNLKTHPLFSHEPTRRNAMLVFEPRRLKYMYVTDTTFKPDPDRKAKLAGHGAIDGIMEEYLTEAGLEVHHFETANFYTGVGEDGATS